MSDEAWSEQRVAKLRTLWTAGHSASEIARRMHLNKNQVVGKAHRLKLTPRRSPIGRQSTIDPNKPRTERRAAAKQIVAPVAVSALPPEAPPPEPPPSAPVVAPPPPAPVRGTCSYPIGEPGTRGFRFCDEPTASARQVYCDAHHAICWQKSGAKAA